jgi:phosphopantetheine adenylyltransferase
VLGTLALSPLPSHPPPGTPQAPTQAELDPSMKALVVSRETIEGGESINAGENSSQPRPGSRQEIRNIRHLMLTSFSNTMSID